MLTSPETFLKQCLYMRQRYLDQQPAQRSSHCNLYGPEIGDSTLSGCAQAWLHSGPWFTIGSLLHTAGLLQAAAGCGVAVRCCHTILRGRNDEDWEGCLPSIANRRGRAKQLLIASAPALGKVPDRLLENDKQCSNLRAETR